MTPGLLIVAVVAVLFALAVIWDNRRHLIDTHHEDDE